MSYSKISAPTLLFFSLSLLVYTACKKSAAAPDISTSITATVNGTPVVWSNIKTTMKKGLNSKMYLQITGDISDTSYMGLDLYIHDIGPTGTVDVTKSYFADFALQTGSGSLYESGNFNDASTGIITITKNDTTAKRVEGAFSGVAENDDQNAGNTRTITKGVFKLSY